MSKFAIGMMFQDESEWLRLHLPVIAQALESIDGALLIGMDGGSTDDSAEVFKSFGGIVHHRPFDFDFGAQANALLDAARAEGADTLLRLDPDELMFPEAVAEIARALEYYSSWLITRVNFAHTRLHHVPEWMPDYQFRAVRLKDVVRYDGRVHERLIANSAPMPAAATVVIYHYSGLRGREAGGKRDALYTALGKGESADWSVTPTGWTWPKVELFRGRQPLDPLEVGLYAPYSRAPEMLITSNLGGDRGIEYGWCEQHLGDGAGKSLLDLGSAGHSHLSAVARQRGYAVTGLDQQPFAPPEGVQGIVGDMRTVKGGQYDVIVNCSTVEHVGLAGRYGVTDDDEDGDLKAMQNLRHLLKPDGVMLLTIPVGRDYVHKPLHRVYGHERLPKLLDGYVVRAAAFWVKHGEQWCEVSRDEALNTYTISLSEDWRANHLALGGFVLEAVA